MNSSFRHLREMFAAQFDADGDGFIYRYSNKGPAIRVTAAEREAFLKQFGRSLWLMVGLIIAAILAWFAAFAFYIGQDREPPEGLVYLGLVGIAAGSGAASYWAWRAPVRALRARTPVARAKTGEEYRREYLGKLGYGQLAFAGLFGVAVPFLVSRDFDVFSGWNRLWFVFGGGLVIVALVQAVRKWRIERRRS